MIEVATNLQKELNYSFDSIIIIEELHTLTELKPT